jgi:hypothetical protein
MKTLLEARRAEPVASVERSLRTISENSTPVSQCRSRGSGRSSPPCRTGRAPAAAVRTPYESLLAQVARENGVPLLDGELGSRPRRDNAEDFIDALHLSARAIITAARRRSPL